ncbi:HD family phosphohydrolase [Gayadomonas joobiniege]|uniref:HD family phosphohydrolase n=1 Tax=Gayadomonas joobiniege TaxID=1234606 RepID=UPI00037B55B6|nr:HD family phosphohydrolase [Gayadomonas joobiniege]
MSRHVMPAAGLSIDQQIDYLIRVATSLSIEKNTHKLLEEILLAAQALTGADGGTIYSVTVDQELAFETLINHSLDLHLGGSSQKTVNFAPIPLKVDGHANQQALVAQAANLNKVINIQDVYQNEQGIDLTAAKKMDQQTGYRTVSVLAVPMSDPHGKLFGVIQLINARVQTPDGNLQVVPFSKSVEKLVCALASQASVVLNNRKLVADMQSLFQTFSKLIAESIDQKSPYTGGHCRRVPEITMLLADAVNQTTAGPLADFHLSDDDMYELSIAAWLHDCGKVGTPEYIMDKATKLETVFDRIELIKTRFSLFKKDLELQTIKQSLNLPISDRLQLLAECEAEKNRLDDDFKFLQAINFGCELMSEEAISRVANIAARCYLSDDGQRQPLLTKDEVKNLTIVRGTLNDDERKIINQHIDITIKILNSLPFPDHLKNVPEYAGGHHEKMDGTGYPLGLTREQMSVPARMMAIADIFEALTSSDRPYKKTKTLSECLRILGFMKLDKHIDPDLFDIFIEQKVYLKFAQVYLSPEQIDPIDESKIPGYKGNPPLC